MGGPDVQHRGGQSIFLHTLMDIFFFCRGHGPPKGQRGSAPVCSNPRYCNTDMNIIREKWEWDVVDPGFHFRGKIGSNINPKNIDQY